MMSVPFGNVLDVNHGCDVKANKDGGCYRYSGLAQALANIACGEDLTQSVSGSQYNSDSDMVL